MSIFKWLYDLIVLIFFVPWTLFMQRFGLDREGNLTPLGLLVGGPWILLLWLLVTGVLFVVIVSAAAFIFYLPIYVFIAD